MQIAPVISVYLATSNTPYTNFDTPLPKNHRIALSRHGQTVRRQSPAHRPHRFFSPTTHSRNQKAPTNHQHFPILWSCHRSNTSNRPGFGLRWQHAKDFRETNFGQQCHLLEPRIKWVHRTDSTIL